MQASRGVQASGLFLAIIHVLEAAGLVLRVLSSSVWRNRLCAALVTIAAILWQVVLVVAEACFAGHWWCPARPKAARGDLG